MRTVFEELARRLRRTDLLLLRAVRRQRSRPAMRAKGQFWGSVITDDEVDALLRAHGEIDWPDSPDGLADAVAASAALRDETEGRVHRLRHAFDLDGDDADLLLLAIAPEISSGYARIFAYLNDNLNQGYLTVDLATRVLRTHRTERLALQARLMSNAPLVRNRLLMLYPNDGAETLSSRRVHPAGRLLRWLLEEEELPEGTGFRPMRTDVEPFVPAVTRTRISEIAHALQRPVTIAVIGSTIGSREGAAMAIARAAGRPLVRVDLERAQQYIEQPSELIRELRLSRALPYVVNVVTSQEDPAQKLAIVRLGSALAALPYPVLIGGADRRSIGDLLGSERPSLTVQVGRTSLDERIGAWSTAFEGRGWSAEPASELSERFYSVGGTTIPQVLERAEAECGGNEPTIEAIWDAARECSRPEMQGLAQHVVPKYRFEDLILPDKIMGQLVMLKSYLAEQETVFHKWGAIKVRPRGFGIKALFSGGPGTGKTMAAECIAGALGLDMYRVDTSSVISRWVGETEKNLREIFDAAEGGAAVILFDEADSLFGSRGEVKQAQDRFANQEVAFLLQRLEVFEGCAILTTNLQENIDEAFLRRFGAVIEFPMPSIEARRQLWHRAIPSGAPRAPDLDLDVIAKQFVLAGGNIVSSAINACIIASAAREDVGMKHVVEAVAREMIKMGKQVSRVHFGEFYDFVQDL
ncbi:MAG: ATP-binding protein [Alphaproteobacteria bacterium]|nr:ATP-binding protein [Alphaproteobacteria bacterium]